MSTEYQSDEPTDNERLLRQLAWALEASVGQLKLILVRCNYSILRLRLIERLCEICQIEIIVLQLKESSITLYSAICEEIEDDTQAVMIVGWESLRDLPQMLSNANQVREAFLNNLSLAIVLWINEEIHHQLMQLARLTCWQESVYRCRTKETAGKSVTVSL